MSDEESIEYESEEEEESEGSEEEEEEEEEVEEVKVVKKKRGKPQKDPNKPKRNLSAFFIYSNDHRSRIKKEDPSLSFGEVARALSAAFKGLSAKDRKRYDALAAKDKQRYLKEMENYEPPSDDDDNKSKKKKQKKDPLKPKRNLSAFFIYSGVVRETVRKENPEAKFGDIARLISTQFKALDEDERAIYDKKAAQDKVRYQKEMAGYTAPS